MIAKRLCLAAVALAVALQGAPAAAQDVYVKSQALADTWKGAGAALAEAEYLKVYDDELARLAAYARRQDLAVARNGVANRDDTVSNVLASRRAAARPPLSTLRLPQGVVRPAWPADTAQGQLQGILDLDFELLLGGTPGPAKLNGLASLEEVLASRSRRLANYEDAAVDGRREYNQLRPKPTKASPSRRDAPRAESAPAPKPLDTSCDALSAMPAAERTRALDAAGDGRRALDRLFKVCKTIGDLRARDERDIADFARLPDVDGQPVTGELHAAFDALKAGRDQISPKGATELVTRLKAELKKADAANTHNQKELAAFRKAVGEVLKAALDAQGNLPSPVAQELALGDLATEIDAYLRADVCDAGKKVPAEMLAAAKCSEIAAGSTTDKVQAAWGFLQALALLADATSPDARSAPWLAGAKAIVAAAEADAKLRTEEAKVVARQRQERFRALLVQASALAQSQQAIDGELPGCVDAVACAVVHYADSRDRGATPAEILSWREIYTERDYAIRRERASADKERQLLLAASAQMEAHVNGGIEPRLIAELFQALGITLIALP